MPKLSQVLAYILWKCKISWDEEKCHGCDNGGHNEITCDIFVSKYH